MMQSQMSQKRGLACLHCTQYKRSCDRASPVCGTCSKAGKQCVYKHNLSAAELQKIREIEREKRRARLQREARAKANKQGTTPPLEVAKLGALALSVGEMTKLETLMDEHFLLSCLDNFERNMGALFCFKDEFADLASLHATPAMSVRTDAALAVVYRGMGWSQQANLSLARAKTKIGAVIAGNSKVEFSAMTMLALMMIGGEMGYFPLLMRVLQKTRTGRDVEMDLCQSLGFLYQGCLLPLLIPEAQELFLIAAQSTLPRVQMRATHVRRQLESKVPLAQIATFGPYDYADLRGGWHTEDVMDETLAWQKLAELDSVEERMSKFDQTSWTVIFENERFALTGSALRCVLHHYLGHVDVAKRWAHTTIDLFDTVRSTMCFFLDSTDLVHMIDFAIAIQDRDLFDRAMRITKRMAPLYPIAERLLNVFSDPSALFGEKVDLGLETSEERSCCADLEEMMEEALIKGALDEWIETA